MQSPAFLSLSPVPLPNFLPTLRTTPTAKKSGGSGKKARKPPRSKRSSQPSTPSPSAPSPQAAPEPLSSSFQGPFDPNFPQDPPLPPSEPQSSDEDFEDIPVTDESFLKLPNLAPTTGIKRKRKMRAASTTDSDLAKSTSQQQQPEAEVDRLSSEKIRELAAAYRRGGTDAADIITELEKNPDFLVQTGNPQGEYDLASAIIGTGRPNKQGVYLLPYLQSSHVLLLTVVLVCVFVYYPGFPLTELDESVREGIKKGLAATYVLNAALAVLAYRDAKKRGQPQLFWALKTAFLGNLALRELRVNAPIQKEK